MNKLACILIIILPIPMMAQSQRSTSEIGVAGRTFEGRPVDVLQKIATQYAVVIGVSGVLVQNEERVVKFAIDRGSLKDVFDEVVRQDPRLSWHETKDGAIHFSIRRSPLTLMDVEVHSLKVDKPPRWKFSEMLNEIPEVNHWLLAHRCTMQETIIGHAPNDWVPFSLSINNLSLAFLLDKIALESKMYFWSAIQYSDQPCSINVRP